MQNLSYLTRKQNVQLTVLQYLHLQLPLLYSMDLSHLHQWRAGLLLVLGISTLVCLEKKPVKNSFDNKAKKLIKSS